MSLVKALTPILYVAWRDPRSRLILPVARLVRCEDGTYEFAYVKGCDEATEHGFEPFIAFPDRYVVYHCDTLPPFFQNRVMQSTRPDYNEYVTSLGLDPKLTEPFTLLAANDGRRATDQVEVFPELQVDSEGRVHGRFLARGVRHIEGAEEHIEKLSEGDRLFCMCDVQNQVNPNAIALRTAQHAVVGYAPDYLADELTRLLEHDADLLVKVERINRPPAPRHHRLLLTLDARYPGYQGLRTGRYEPLVSDATPVPPVVAA
jgi:hypothetical protein